MNRMTGATFRIVAAMLFVTAGLALADDLGIDWYSIDGGGVMLSGGGGFQLSGTIGQADAGPVFGSMSGGDFEIRGGFWPAFVPGCACLGDMNGDGKRDGSDIQRFLTCIVAGGSCACSDVDGNSVISIDDVADFVNDLLTGQGCG